MEYTLQVWLDEMAADERTAAVDADSVYDAVSRLNVSLSTVKELVADGTLMPAGDGSLHFHSRSDLARLPSSE